MVTIKWEWSQEFLYGSGHIKVRVAMRMWELLQKGGSGLIVWEWSDKDGSGHGNEQVPKMEMSGEQPDLHFNEYCGCKNCIISYNV